VSLETAAGHFYTQNEYGETHCLLGAVPVTFKAENDTIFKIPVNSELILMLK
jgi:hypothetical protein